MNSHPDQIDAEIKETLTTLFHSYDARGNDLAIAKAHAAVKVLVLKERIAEIKRKMTLNIELLSSADYKAGFSEALDQIDVANEVRIETLEGEIKEMQG